MAFSKEEGKKILKLAKKHAKTHRQKTNKTLFANFIAARFKRQSKRKLSQTTIKRFLDQNGLTIYKGKPMFLTSPQQDILAAYQELTKTRGILYDNFLDLATHIRTQLNPKHPNSHEYIRKTLEKTVGVDIKEHILKKLAESPSKAKALLRQGMQNKGYKTYSTLSAWMRQHGYIITMTDARRALEDRGWIKTRYEPKKSQRKNQKPYILSETQKQSITRIHNVYSNNPIQIAKMMQDGNSYNRTRKAVRKYMGEQGWIL